MHVHHINDLSTILTARPSCVTSKDLWDKLALIYEEISEENFESSRKDNMFCNSNDKNKTTHFYLMANEGVENQDTSDSDADDDNACTSDDEEEEEETGNDIPNEVYDFLNNYSKQKLIKVLLYYIRREEEHISKIKKLMKIHFELSQENIDF